MPKKRAENWDLFISHASEDKPAFVEPLASALAAYGVKVWFDKFTLRIGDSLSKSIDNGLARSSHGLVVLSPAFIAKRWPAYELRGLIAGEIGNGKTIIPIWHNISYKKLLRFSPPLADKFAIKSDGLNVDRIAIEIIRVVRPDIFTRVMRRNAFNEAMRTAEKRMARPSDLRDAPIQHPVLPPELIGRIRLVRAALLSAYPHSMEFWLSGFQRDLHPTSEVRLWERIAAGYSELAAMTPSLDRTQREQLVRLFLALSMTNDEKYLKTSAKGLPNDALEKATAIYAGALPVYDFDEKSPFSDDFSAEELEMFKRYDKEYFPDISPETDLKPRSTSPKKNETSSKGCAARMSLQQALR